jgi:hypothetical protein
MTGVLDRQRSSTLAVLAMIAAACVGLAVLGTGLEQARSGEIRASGKVFAGIRQTFPDVRQIRVTTPAGSYRLVRDGAGWVMPERSNYPVSRPTLEALARGLADLERRAERSADPGQYNRLGVAEPREGGDGTLLEMTDGNGALLGSAWIGQRGDATYVRQSDSPTVFLASGSLPPLAEPAAWLDLRVLDIGAEQIASVEIEAGPDSHAILRRPDGGFALDGTGAASPGATAAAVALSRFDPVDVAPLGSLASVPVAGHHVTLLRDGTQVTLEARVDGDGAGWVSVTASGPQGEAIAARASGWAYRLAPYDFADLGLSGRAALPPPAGDEQP